MLSSSGDPRLSLMLFDLRNAFFQHGLSKRLVFPVGGMDELILATVYPFQCQKSVKP